MHYVNDLCAHLSAFQGNDLDSTEAGRVENVMGIE